MATDFASFTLAGLLEGKALRNWLRTDGAGLFSIFDTGADAYRFLQDAGVDIARSTFYTIRKQVLNVVSSSNNLINYPDNQLIPMKWHVTDHGMNLTTDFQYRIHMFGYDSETGILKDQWMTVASDRQLTPNQIREVARGYVGEGGVSGDIQDFRFAEIEPMRR